jgi:EAL domain-containing protein (putative c-di-GMP-specific phosphodiesterase class I)
MNQATSDQQDWANFAVNHPFNDLNTLISHELRTPLTSIRGVLGLLQSGQLTSLTEEGQRLLKIAINNTNRLIRLADAIDQDASLDLTILSAKDIEQLQLENELYSALEQQEFHLFYQPIISTETGQIICFEALARWHHPYRGIVSPEVFIPMVEKNGLIHQLGMNLMNQACQQLKLWQTQFSLHQSLSVSVNLSPIQLLQPRLVHQIKEILERNEIAPQHLKLEITESALSLNCEGAIAILSELKAIGVQFYIDDFGIGYSSLGRLQDFPINALKIDRSFIYHQQWDITSAIILLASHLGLEVIAEGVETLEEIAYLKQLGCKRLQGYFFSQPVDSRAATMLLENSLYVPEPTLGYQTHPESAVHQ